MEEVKSDTHNNNHHNLKESAQRLKTNVSEYMHTYVELTKAKVTQTASTAASGAAIGVTALFLGIFFLFFLFCGVAFWVGDLINSRAGGFFIVAGFFLLLVVLVFALRKNVIVPAIRNAIISKVYE
jgi:Flp pilus assembly protein TadB